MSRTSAHHGINQIPVIGKKQKPLRILIKPSGISHPHRKFHHVRNFFVRKLIPLRTGNPHRFVIGKDNFFVFSPQELTVYRYPVTATDPGAHGSHLSVYRNFSVPDQLISISSGTNSAGCKIFV